VHVGSPPCQQVTKKSQLVSLPHLFAIRPFLMGCADWLLVSSDAVFSNLLSSLTHSLFLCTDLVELKLLVSADATHSLVLTLAHSIFSHRLG
jgi:hypothetical protein